MSENDNLNAIDRQLFELDQQQTNDNQRDENVNVIVRCRPLLKSIEQDSCLEVNEDDNCVQLGDRQFYFDAVFGPQSDNETVYMKSVRKLIESSFRGFNCTIFLYGQTGTGKTYTNSSLTLSSFAHLFSLIRDSNTQARFLVRASYYELYNEDIRDLLSNSNKALELRESRARGVYVKDLTCYLVNNIADLERLKRLGDKRRATAATKMNEHSSRSHSIFSMTIETLDNEDPNIGKNLKIYDKKRAESDGSVRVGRIHLIDLAGSERQSKSGSTGTRLKEASRINLSLTCLSLVIRALTDSNSTHVPYRNSKLTRLLSSSLGGNSKTLLIACISPSRTNLDETLNTLRFASRTKRIKNTAVINEDAKDALLRKYRRQIDELKLKLEEQQSKSTAMTEKEALKSLEVGQHQKQLVDNHNGELLQQLRLLREKIMVGGENLLEKAEMHDRLLEASRNELEEKRQKELKLKQNLQMKRDLIEQMTKSEGNLQDQLMSLDEKLEKVSMLFKITKEEEKDLTSEHQQLKESLLQTIRATSKEIKYADCIIEDFIPREYLDLINTYAQYDDESDEWQIKYIALSGNNIAQTKSLTENKAAMSSESNDAAIKQRNNKRSDPYVRLKDLVR